MIFSENNKIYNFDTQYLGTKFIGFEIFHMDINNSIFFILPLLDMVINIHEKVEHV